MPARVRWGNVGRAAVVAGAMALVVAWPRLGGPPVALPGGEAVPVLEGEGRVAPSVSERRRGPVRERDGGGGREVEPRPGRRPTAPVREGDEGGRREVEARPERRPTAPVREGDEPPGATSEPPAPAPPPAPTVDPAEREFGFER
jgi:hypothetical protein